MGLEDLAMFRAMANSKIFYPSDAISAERATEICANSTGIRYIRTSRFAIYIYFNLFVIFSNENKYFLNF